MLNEELKIAIAEFRRDIIHLGEKFDDFAVEQRQFNALIDDRVTQLEQVVERWKGYWLGGLAVCTAIFSLITLIARLI